MESSRKPKATVVPDSLLSVAKVSKKLKLKRQQLALLIATGQLQITSPLLPLKFSANSVKAYKLKPLLDA